MPLLTTVSEIPVISITFRVLTASFCAASSRIAASMRSKLRR